MIPFEIIQSIRVRLCDRAEEVCRLLLPGGKRKGVKWVCGDISGNPGDSLSVELEGNKAGLWRDYATDGGGDLLKLWMECRGLDFPQAVEQAGDFARVEIPKERKTRRLPLDDYEYSEPPAPRPAAKPPVAAVSPFLDEPSTKPAEVSPFLDDNTPPAPRPKLRRASEAGEPVFDWAKCVAALTPEHLAKLADWRGFSLDFVEFLAGASLIGLVGGNWALPVHDPSGIVVRAHYRVENGDWIYTKGNVNAPLVIGDPAEAGTTFLFESQWDAFAVLDALRHQDDPRHYAAIVTRGASSNLELGALLAKAAIVIAVPQNDPPEKKNKDGRTPAEEWLFKIKKGLPASAELRVAPTPEGFKDTNDWIRADKPDHRDVLEALVEGAMVPGVRPSKTIADLLDYPTEDDPNCLLGKRFLCKGGSLILTGPSGAGKSTLMADMILSFAAGEPWHGIVPKRPLKQVVFQAENDDGDIAEMVKAALARKRKEWVGDEGKAKFRLANQNIRFVHVNDTTGEKWCQMAEINIRYHKADMAWGDPLLSFVGDDISKQDVASKFLRDWLNPVLSRTGCVMAFIHHTGKPSSDAKARSHWSESDYAYAGLGSSEITNWSRAVMHLSHTKEKGIYKLTLAKRGSRAGLQNHVNESKDEEGRPITSIYLAQGKGNEIGWFRVPPPVEDEDDRPERKSRKESIEKSRSQGHDPHKAINFVAWPAKWMDAVVSVRNGMKIDEESAKAVLHRANEMQLIYRDHTTQHFHLRTSTT